MFPSGNFLVPKSPKPPSDPSSTKKSPWIAFCIAVFSCPRISTERKIQLTNTEFLPQNLKRFRKCPVDVSWSLDFIGVFFGEHLSENETGFLWKSHKFIWFCCSLVWLEHKNRFKTSSCKGEPATSVGLRPPNLRPELLGCSALATRKSVMFNIITTPNKRHLFIFEFYRSWQMRPFIPFKKPTGWWNVVWQGRSVLIFFDISSYF